MFNFIGRYLNRLWRFASFWRVSPIGQARIGSPLAGLLLFVVLVFGTVALGIVIVGGLFGYSPEQALGAVDSAIAWAAPTLDFIGKILIQKVLMGIVLLICMAVPIVLIFFRDGDAPGWLSTAGILFLCTFVGYCSGVNMLAPLDPYAG